MALTARWYLAKSERNSDSLSTAVANGSIAVSVILQHSVTLKLLRISIATGCLLIAALVACGAVGELSFLARGLLMVVPLVGALSVIAPTLRQRPTCRLDISGRGEIRLSEVSEESPAHSLLLADKPAVLQLCDGSLLSAALLVLRLKQPGGHINTVTIFPDSVSTEAFRRLSVACRWIAARQLPST